MSHPLDRYCVTDGVHVVTILMVDSDFMGGQGIG